MTARPSCKHCGSRGNRHVKNCTRNRIKEAKPESFAGKSAEEIKDLIVACACEFSDFDFIQQDPGGIMERMDALVRAYRKATR